MHKSAYVLNVATDRQLCVTVRACVVERDTVRMHSLLYFRKKADGEPDKETIAKQAIAAAKVWEAKYTATEDSRQTYRLMLCVCVRMCVHMHMQATPLQYI